MLPPEEPPPRNQVKISSTGRIRTVETDIFVVHFTPDCMSHACVCKDEGDRQLDDACCQHGCDVDLFEKARILARKDEVARVLAAPWKDPARWFDERDPEHDEQAYPSGTAVRSATQGETDNSRCVFLAHDARGCALHRAALESGFAPEEIKPAVCRLYPLAVDGDFCLGLSDDFERYDCAGDMSGPTLYRLMRGTLADIYGEALVRRLDQVERSMLGHRLPIAARL
jgi:Fe-S-cluster containining protein